MISDAVSIAMDVVDLLESIQGAEEAQAQKAALLIRSSISGVCSLKPMEFDRLRHDLSSKGILDWRWSANVLPGLEALCDAFYEVSVRREC